MIGVRDIDLGSFQRAAKALLVHGMLTPQSVDDATWRSAARFAEPLDDAFRSLAGYRVVRGRAFVRLVRRLDRLCGHPVFSTPSRRPFDRTRYALVVLAVAALEQSGGQTTLTDLARRIRASCDRMDGLVFDPDQHISRLALGHAVAALEKLGALRLADGSREAWEQRQDDAEALFDIERDIVRALFPLPGALTGSGGVEALLVETGRAVGRDTGRRLRRQRLARRLLESPVVYRADLDDAERAFLHKEARTLADELEELTGASLERRREGFALIAPGRRFSDRPFPAGGGDNQAALLLASRLVGEMGDLPRQAAPHGDDGWWRLAAAIDEAAPAEVGAGAWTSPADVSHELCPFADDATLARIAGELCDALGPALNLSHRGAPEAFLRDGVAVLVGYDLVRPVPGGVTLMPALGRFREPRVDAPPELQAQLGLFGGGHSGGAGDR
jgi:uncharacterized protein (TIGR02678 family)